MSAYAYSVLKEQDDHESRWAAFELWMQDLSPDALCEYMQSYLEQLRLATGPVAAMLPTSVGSKRPTATVEFRGWWEFQNWLYDRRREGKA